LADWPYHLGEMMPRLADAADDTANEALEWANGSNADLDPSDLTTFGPTDLTTFGPGREAHRRKLTGERCSWTAVNCRAPFPRTGSRRGSSLLAAFEGGYSWSAL
jgi:hypothetical protein